MAEPGVAPRSGSAMLLRVQVESLQIANASGVGRVLEPRPTMDFPSHSICYLLFAICYRAALLSRVAPRTTIARLVADLWTEPEHTLPQPAVPGL
jgi:hypothetical protein